MQSHEIAVVGAHLGCEFVAADLNDETAFDVCDLVDRLRAQMAPDYVDVDTLPDALRERYLSADNHNPLVEGMVFHLPLTLRRLGEYGAGFSETVIIGADGAQPLSRLPRTL